jgi:uncharacterized OB-fold protein
MTESKSARPLPEGHISMSPLETYLQYCQQGKLAYQIDNSSGQAVFHPRLVAPKSGSDDLDWHVSLGLGRVYATTTVHRKDSPPYNVALVDVDEGFRMMSRVEDIDPQTVKIGMRVRMRMHPGSGDQAPYPVFTPEQGEQAQGEQA